METEKRGSVIVSEEEKQTDEAGFWPTSSPPHPGEQQVQGLQGCPAAALQPKAGSPLPWLLGKTLYKKQLVRLGTGFKPSVNTYL